MALAASLPHEGLLTKSPGCFSVFFQHIILARIRVLGCRKRAKASTTHLEFGCRRAVLCSISTIYYGYVAFWKTLDIEFIFIVAIASLLVSQWAAYNAPTANFFLLPTRGWELAIGAGVAFYFLYRKPLIRSLLSHKVIDELLSWLGLALIGYAAFFFDGSTPFPSVYTLVPTIGTALVIIFSSKDTVSGKLLGSKIFVGIGLISYSAYLWHQPLFAFARHRSLQEPGFLLLAALSILTYCWHFLAGSM